MLAVASFFAGIGGFDLGMERAGMRTVFQCEIDELAQKILKRHWPKVPIHGDITTLQASNVPAADVWCAGWPCQDLSHANSDREGLSGKRSGLFYTFADLVSAARPRWLVMENVPGLLSADDGTALESVVGRLEEDGYVGGWFSCDLLDAGLPHHRDRVFIVASRGQDRGHRFFVDGGKLHGDFAERGTRRKKAGPGVRGGSEGHSPLLVQRRGGFGYTAATGVCPTIRAQTGRHQGGHSDRPILCGEKLDVGRVRAADGVPRGMDGRRGRFIGNAVSPVIVEWIGRRIVQIEQAAAREEDPTEEVSTAERAPSRLPPPAIDQA